MQNATADFSEPVKFQEVNFPYPYCGRNWPSFKERERYYFFLRRTEKELAGNSRWREYIGLLVGHTG